MIKLPVKTTKTFTATSYWTFGDGLEPNEVLIKTKWTRAPNPEMINLPFYFTHDELWKSWTHEIHQPFPQKPQTSDFPNTPQSANLSTPRRINTYFYLTALSATPSISRIRRGLECVFDGTEQNHIR